MSRKYKKTVKQLSINNITKDFLIQRYEKEKISLRKICIELDICMSTLRKLIKKFKIKTRRKKKKYVLINKKFNKLTVIKETIKSENIKNKSMRYWECKCECGNITTVSSSNLIQGAVKSCGCSRLYKNKKLYKKYGQEVINNGITSVYWYRLLTNASKRNIEFNIDMEYGYEKYLEQNKLCALSGREIRFVNNYSKNGSNQTASLDRIDSSKGYIEGNVQWVHKDLNRIKSDLSDDEFISICKEVSLFRKK